MPVIDIHTTENRYATILADPPWPYEQKVNTRQGQRGIEATTYKTMTIEEIAQTPVRHLADKKAALWLWTTGPFLHDAFHVVTAWGFRYKTCRVWVKTSDGQRIGYWFRGHTEYLLLATRGGLPRVGAPSQRSYFSTDKNLPHSQKPRQSYEDIERMTPAPRIELFARRSRKGWDCWGLEAKELDLELEADMEALL